MSFRQTDCLKPSSSSIVCRAVLCYWQVGDRVGTSGIWKPRSSVSSSYLVDLNSPDSIDAGFLGICASLIGLKKPPHRWNGCAAVGFAPTPPLARALLVLCYFPRFPFFHIPTTLSTILGSSSVRYPSSSLVRSGGNCGTHAGPFRYVYGRADLFRISVFVVEMDYRFGSSLGRPCSFWFLA